MFMRVRNTHMEYYLYDREDMKMEALWVII